MTTKSNWKTTLAGIVAGLALLVSNATQAKANGGDAVTFGNLVPPAALIVLGALAKDHSND